MEATAIAKQMFGFQKTIFDNGYSAMTVVQDQTENMLSTFMGQFPFMAEEGKKQMDETFSYARKAREDYKKTIDDGYTRFEKLFD